MSETDARPPPGMAHPSRRTITSARLGSTMRWTAYSRETGGAYTEVECTVQPGFRNPPHRHTRFSETFVPTAGTLTVTCVGSEGEQEQLELGPGARRKVAVGEVHALLNGSTGEARFTCRLEPGCEGFERGMYVMHGLAEDGLTDAEGVPRNPVHAALLAGLMDVWPDGWLWWAATPLLAYLRRLGKGSGEEERLLEKYWFS